MYPPNYFGEVLLGDSPPPPPPPPPSASVSRAAPAILLSVNTEAVYSREITAPRTLLSLISLSDSNVTVSGGVIDGGSLDELFTGDLSNTTIQKINISGIFFLQITVNSGDQVAGNIS